jgi:plasmid rolling circle replication initiator protein Rep
MTKISQEKYITPEGKIQDIIYIGVSTARMREQTQEPLLSRMAAKPQPPLLSLSGSDLSVSQEPERLENKINGKTQPWRKKKYNTNKVSLALHKQGFNKKANSIWWCGSELEFNSKNKLISANFCRERLCVMCSWRNSIKNFYQLSKVMDTAQEENPTFQPIFLTLTARNCTADELPELISTMFKGWYRVTNHRRFKENIKGWFRALEVTYNHKKDTYHPHFHAILVVDKPYFKNMIETRDWVHIWRTSCKFDYDPICDIRAVKTSKDRNRQHLAEVSKYTVKDSDIVHKDDKKTQKVVYALGKAIHRRWLFAYGGELKKIKKRLELKDPKKSPFPEIIFEDATVRGDIADVIKKYKWDFGLQDYFRR